MTFRYYRVGSHTAHHAVYEGLAVELQMFDQPKPGASLALALIASSQVPLLLLSDDLAVVGASRSFCGAFGIDPEEAAGVRLADLGAGEWNVPQLHWLLRATAAGDADVDAFEMELVRRDVAPAYVLLNAHRLAYDEAKPLVVVTITDVTSARLAERIKDGLVQEKQVLLQELQHRVANSLQIIASVLMQSARRVRSEEARGHLQDAHRRVMSIATLQKQLAVSSNERVELFKYLRDLCASIGASMIDDEERIVLTATVDDSSVTADVSVSLGLIVTELVINSLKHAFPRPDQHGVINVGYSEQGTGFKLTVADNGTGIKAGYGQGRPGLGTGIIDALAKQLGAMVQTKDTARGTEVSVVRAA